MAMTTAAGGAAIENALQEEIADFAKKRGNNVALTQDEAYDENVALVAKIKARIMTDIDAAWSD